MKVSMGRIGIVENISGAESVQSQEPYCTGTVMAPDIRRMMAYLSGDLEGSEDYRTPEQLKAMMIEHVAEYNASHERAWRGK